MESETNNDLMDDEKRLHDDGQNEKAAEAAVLATPIKVSTPMWKLSTITNLSY